MSRGNDRGTDKTLQLRSYKDFLLTQPDDITPDVAQKAYDVYRKEYHSKNARKFLETHQDEDWFKERYHPNHEVYKQSQDNATRKAMFTRNFTVFCNSYRTGHTLFPFFDLNTKEAEEDEENTERNFINNIIICASLPANASREALLKLFEAEEGFQYLFLTSADSANRFSRAGFILFTSQKQCKAVMEKYDQHKMSWGIMRLRANKSNINRFLPTAVTDDVERVQNDLSAALQLANKLDTLRGLENGLFEEEEVSKKPPIHRLNLAVSYLRCVHLYNYYTAKQYKTLEKCFDAEFASADGSTVVLAEDWVDVIKKGVEDVTAAVSVDVKVVEKNADGDEPEDEFVTKYKNECFDEQIVRKGAERFKCAMCTKLFMGPVFVKKHIAVKHPEIIETATVKGLQERFVENFLQDDDQPHEAEKTESCKESREISKGDSKDEGSRSGDGRGQNKERRSPTRGGQEDSKTEDRKRSPRRSSRDRDRDQDRGKDRDKDRDRDVIRSRGPRDHRSFRNTPMRPPPTPADISGREVISYAAVSYEDCDLPAEVEALEVDYGFGDDMDFGFGPTAANTSVEAAKDSAKAE